MSKTTIVIIGILLLGLIGTLAYSLSRPEAPKIGTLHPSEGQQHLNTLDQQHSGYKSDPPTSGPHYVQPAAWGVSEAEIADEQLIHNLEHGGVIITYSPNMNEVDRARLEEVARELTANDKQESNKGFKVILAPRAKNKSPIQLTSWTYSLTLQEVNVATIQQFYREHLNNAPEARAAG